MKYVKELGVFVMLFLSFSFFFISGKMFIGIFFLFIAAVIDTI